MLILAQLSQQTRRIPHVIGVGLWHIDITSLKALAWWMECGPSHHLCTCREASCLPTGLRKTYLVCTHYAVCILVKTHFFPKTIIQIIIEYFNNEASLCKEILY